MPSAPPVILPDGSNPTPPVPPVVSVPLVAASSLAHPFAVSGTLSPDIAGFVFWPAGVRNNEVQWSIDGTPSAPASGDWWLISWRDGKWYFDKYVAGVLTLSPWSNYTGGHSPVLHSAPWDLAGGATGQPVLTYLDAPVPLPSGSSATPGVPPVVTPPADAPGLGSRITLTYPEDGFPEGDFTLIGTSPFLGDVWKAEDAEVSMDEDGVLFGSGAVYVRRDIGATLQWSLESSVDWEVSSPTVLMVGDPDAVEPLDQPSPLDVEVWYDTVNDVSPGVEEGFSLVVAGKAAPPTILGPSSSLTPGMPPTIV